MEKNKKKANEIHQSFINGQSYKAGIGLTREITRSINFVEGKQWSNDEATDDYPKIVLNVIKQIMRVRQSGILQNDYSFLVNTLRFEDARKIQYFLKFLYNKLKIRKKNIKVVADNFKKGTSGLYFYWDKDSRSVLSDSQGELRCEVFDVRNMVVADPELTDIQDQEWIIYHTREKVEALRKQYPEKAKEIVSDGFLETGATQKEMYGLSDEEEFASVYIKFYRNAEGQVCYIISTATVVLEEAQALNPYYSGSVEEMPNTLSVNDKKETHEYNDVVFGVYPFAVYVMDARDNCFYGMAGAYEYIEAQKSINAHFSTYDYGISQNVLGGFVMRKGVLGDQEITTDNAQILELDMLPNERVGDVFGRMPVNNIPTESLNFGGVLSNMVKMVSGATNVQMGQADYSNQTAKATEMLIARARENTSDYAILFEEYMKDIATIMFMFAKFYYDRKEFNLIEHGNEKDTNIDYSGDKAFVGDDFIMEEVDFDIKVSPSNAFNESILQQLAMMSVQTGNLKMSSVLKMLPYNTFPSFQELKGELAKEDMTQQIMKQMEQTINQQQAVMEQMSMEYQKSQEMLKKVDAIIAENIRLKEERAEFYSKGIEVADQAKAEMFGMQREAQRLVKIAKENMGGEK